MSVTKENLEKWLEIFGDLIESNKAKNREISR